MTNTEIRAHLRKGEQAVELLESMGYVYQDARRGFKAPEAKPEDAILAPVVAALARLAEFDKVDNTIRRGDRFIINSLPPALSAIRASWPDWKTRVFTAGEVNEHSLDAGRFVIRFGHDTVSSHGLWIDVARCQKVNVNDRF